MGKRDLNASHLLSYPDAEIWRSLDGGVTWTTIYSSSYLPPFVSLEPGVVLTRLSQGSLLPSMNSLFRDTTIGMCLLHRGFSHIPRELTMGLQTPYLILSHFRDTRRIGWGIEGLQIDPFDSNHLLWGTGLTLYGTHNLLRWDAGQSIKISSMSSGVEQVHLNH